MKEKIVNKINKAKLAITMFMTTTMFPMTAYATTGTGNADITNLIETVIGWIFNIFAVMGAFKVMQGVYEWVSSQDSEDPNRKEQGQKKVAVGAMLIALKVASTFFSSYIASLLQFS